jgi:hypothetical protein
VNETDSIYIVVSKDQPFIDLCFASVLVVEPGAVLLNHLPKDRPLDATDQAPVLPSIRGRLHRALRSVNNLFVEPSDDLIYAIDPLIPVLPDERTGISLVLQKIDSFVEFSHTLRYLLRRLRAAHFLWCQSSGIEKLLEAAVLEGPKHSGSNTFASETAQYLKLGLSVNEMLHLRTIDSQKKLTGAS